MLRANRQLTLFVIAAALGPFPGRAQEPLQQTALPASAQMPSGPVIVAYENGELTIEALNVPLAVVLRAASSQIGAILEVPSGADEPVVGTFGPGSPAAVIAALLNGSHFNYTMTASPSDRNRVVRIILSKRALGENSTPNKTQQAQVRRDSPTPPPTTDNQETTISVSREQLRTEVNTLLEQASAEAPSEGDNLDINVAGVSQLQKVMEAALARANTLVATGEGRDVNSTKIGQKASTEGFRTDPAGQNVSPERTKQRRR
jgi:hypothetical protein